MELVEAAKMAQEFFSSLRGVRKTSRYRCYSMWLFHEIKHLAQDPVLDSMLTFGHHCVSFMGAHVERSGRQSWEAYGFKHLSFAGFDVSPGDLRVIDYDNMEYLALLELWSLLRPQMSQ